MDWRGHNIEQHTSSKASSAVARFWMVKSAMFVEGFAWAVCGFVGNKKKFRENSNAHKSKVNIQRECWSVAVSAT